MPKQSLPAIFNLFASYFSNHTLEGIKQTSLIWVAYVLHLGPIILKGDSLCRTPIYTKIILNASRLLSGASGVPILRQGLRIDC